MRLLYFSSIIISTFLVYLLGITNNVNEINSILPFQEVIHPTEKNIPSVDSPLSLVKNFKSDNISREYFGKPILSIGKFDATEDNLDEILGEVGGAQLYKNRIFYLDNDLVELRIYDQNGSLLFKKNIEGRGPGEIVRPVNFEIKDDRLFILDTYRKINIYDINDLNIEYVKSILFKVTPEDMCILKDKIIVRGVKINDDSENPNELSSSILHIYSTETFNHIKSIGNGYKSENWLVVNQMSDGPIECIEKEEIVLFSYEYIPFVYGIDLDGNIVGLVDLRDNFQQGMIIERQEDNRPTITFSQNENRKFETIKELNYHPNKQQLLIQSNVGETVNKIRLTRSKTVLFDFRTLTLFEPSFDLPFAKFLGDNYNIGGYSEPYPKIELFKN